MGFNLNEIGNVSLKLIRDTIDNTVELGQKGIKGIVDNTVELGQKGIEFIVDNREEIIRETVKIVLITLHKRLNEDDLRDESFDGSYGYGES